MSLLRGRKKKICSGPGYQHCALLSLGTPRTNWKWLVVRRARVPSPWGGAFSALQLLSQHLKRTFHNYLLTLLLLPLCILERAQILSKRGWS